MCIGDDTRIQCQRDQIITVNKADYGRMEIGECITKVNDFMGCTNDVLPLLDRWCSGRRECTVSVPHNELENMNQDCLEVLIKYLKIEYTCMNGKNL